MKFILLLLLTLIANTTVYAQDNLKKEARIQITELLAKTKNAQGMTADRLFESFSKVIDFSLTETQKTLLEAGKSLRTKEEVTHLIKKAEALKTIRSRPTSEPLFEILKNPKTTVYSIESAYRILDFLTGQQESSMRTLNILNARSLITEQLFKKIGKKPDELEKEQEKRDTRFMSLEGREEWLFNSKGFGELPGKGTVIIMAPKVVSGKIIVALSNGSAINVAVEDLKKTIDISKVKTEVPK